MSSLWRQLAYRTAFMTMVVTVAFAGLTVWFHLNPAECILYR